MINKEERTFETRLLFIKDLFENTFPPEEIMAKCINYKLGISFDQYEENLNTSTRELSGLNPMTLIKKI